MKFTMLSLLALFSMTAMACPDLSGAYRACESDSEDVYMEPFTLEQSNQGKITNFTFIDQAGQKLKLANDGKALTTSEEFEGVIYIQTTTASCVDDKLILNSTVKGGEFISQSKAVFTKHGPVLTVETTSHYDGIKEVSTSTCIE